MLAVYLYIDICLSLLHGGERDYNASLIHIKIISYKKLPFKKWAKETRKVKGFTNASKSNHSNHSFVIRRRSTSSIKAAAAAPLQLNTNTDTIEHVVGGGPDRRSPITYLCQ